MENEQAIGKELAKMSIKAGVEGEGKPMMIKPIESKREIKARIMPVTERKKTNRVNGDSIF